MYSNDAFFNTYTQAHSLCGIHSIHTPQLMYTFIHIMLYTHRHVKRTQTHIFPMHSCWYTITHTHSHLPLYSDETHTSAFTFSNRGLHTYTRHLTHTSTIHKAFWHLHTHSHCILWGYANIWHKQHISQLHVGTGHTHTHTDLAFSMKICSWQS